MRNEAHISTAPRDDAPTRRASSPSVDDTIAATSGAIRHLAATSMHRLAGRTIAGRYRIDVPIGAGTFGAVYAAEDTLTGTAVAVKVLKEQSESEHAAFRREIGFLRKLRLPGVVRFVDDGVDEVGPFLVTDLIEGSHFPGRRYKTWRATADIVVGLLEALDRVHRQGVVHRDLKPGNVLVTHDKRPILLDFGVAQGPRGVRGDYRAAGTPWYMSLEQLLGDAATTQCDLYAVGVMLWELIAGRPAFSSNSVEALISEKRVGLTLNDPSMNVPKHVRDLVEALTANDPADRPATANDAIDALRWRPRATFKLPPPAPDQPEDAPIDRDALMSLFHGPEIVFFLRSDAAEVVFARTGGRREAVTRLLDQWVRSGLCYVDGEKLRITRETLDRLIGALEAERASSPIVAAVARDSAAAATLAGVEGPAAPHRQYLVERGAPATANPNGDAATSRSPAIAVPDGYRLELDRLGGELSALITATGLDAMTLAVAEDTLPQRHDAVSAADHDEVTSAVMRASVARRLGKHCLASAELDGALAIARSAGWAGGESACLIELAKLSLARQSVDAIDLALYELSRAPEFELRDDVEALLRVGRLVRVGGVRDRVYEAAREVPEFRDRELERMRCGNLLLAGQVTSLDLHEQVARELVDWAEGLGDPQIVAEVHGWTAFVEYRHGRFRECARLYEEALQNCGLLTLRLSNLCNLAMALLEAGELDRTLAAADEALDLSRAYRLPYFAAMATWLRRSALYRSEKLSAPSEEVIDAMRAINHPALLGPTAMTEAAAAWRGGHLDDAIRLAKISQDAFGRRDHGAGMALAAALAYECGAELSAAECDDVWAMAESCGAPGIAVQVAALLGRPHDRSPRSFSSTVGRAEVLTPNECVTFAARGPGDPVRRGRPLDDYCDGSHSPGLRSIALPREVRAQASSLLDP